MDRLEKIISEKDPMAEVSKVSKGPENHFRHFRHSGRRAFQKNNSAAAKRHAFRFRLHNGDTGTYMTDEPDLGKARDNLLDRYGDRLALVVRADG